MDISNLAYQLKVVENVLYEQILLSKSISFKYKTIAKPLNRDWKIVEIAKKTITDLIGHIQLIVMVLKKNFDN